MTVLGVTGSTGHGLSGYLQWLVMIGARVMIVIVELSR